MVSFWVGLQIKQHETLLEMQLTPFSILLRALLDQLQTKDQARIFAQPVDVNEVNFSRYMNIFLECSDVCPHQKLNIFHKYSEHNVLQNSSEEITFAVI